MILICDNCHYIFDSDSIEKFPASPDEISSERCPFCDAISVIYTISDGAIHTKETFPALRQTTPSERNTYEKAILKALGSVHLDDKAKKSRVRIEKAIAIINLSADKLSDDEYNMLLIFAFLYGRNADVRFYLNPLLGLERFSPSSHGRSADAKYDTERVYEKVTKLFRSFVTSPNHNQNSLSSDARYVVSFMRQRNMMSVKKTTVRVYRSIINSISIETLCESPGKVYLDTIRRIVDL